MGLQLLVARCMDDLRRTSIIKPVMTLRHLVFVNQFIAERTRLSDGFLASSLSRSRTSVRSQLSLSHDFEDFVVDDISAAFCIANRGIRVFLEFCR